MASSARTASPLDAIAALGAPEPSTDVVIAEAEAAAAAPPTALPAECAVSLQQIEELCRVGTAGETGERQAKALAGSGAKRLRAQHARQMLDILEAGRYTAPESEQEVDISEHLCRAVAASVHLPEAGWQARPAVQQRRERLRLEVRCCTVLAAAQDLAASAEDAALPGVLNFASARNPGGGFTTGAEAQEESLARSSGIYPCLSKHFQAFFVPSRRAASGLYTHDLISSPRVPVLRDEHGTLLEEPYLVDFVTAAAPNCGVLQSRVGAKEAASQCSQALKVRIQRVLQSFAAGGCCDLVLGAWGCGVFGNDPGTVARLFRDGLAEFHCFRRVVFAVLDPRMAVVFGEEMGVAGPGTKLEPRSAAAEEEKANKATGDGKKGSKGSQKASRKQRRWEKGAQEEG